MIIGVLIRVVLEFLRRRGVPVPDLARLRRRQPRLGLTNRAVDGLVSRMDVYLDQRKSERGDDAASWQPAPAVDSRPAYSPTTPSKRLQPPFRTRLTPRRD